jgi:hypothetical protein
MAEDAAKNDAQDDVKQGDQDAGKQSDTGAGGEPDIAAELAKWKAMARKHEGQAKSNADAAKRLAEIEDANKTEVQKLADKATVSDRAAADARQEVARLRVAMRKGLTESQAKRLVGATEEELEADAEELLATFGGTQDTSSGKDGKPTRPKERLRPGAAPNEEPDETDPRKLAASVPRL